MENNNYKIGILAYGSLINDPGEEIIKAQMKERLICKTPFKVEYARTSSSRSGAPTLIPVDEGGAKVNAQIIILNEKISLDEAKNMLYRRETRRKGNYQHLENPNDNKVVIKKLSNFKNIETVLYTSIGRNIKVELSGSVLAKHALDSLKKQAGEDERDGVNYLLNAINNGIVTPLSEEYKSSILDLMKLKSLEEVIQNRNELQ